MKCEVATIGHADNVITVSPVWAPLAVAMAVTGMPKNVIGEWVRAHSVRAKKLNPESPTSTVVYRIEDLLEMVDSLPDYERENGVGHAS